MSWPVIYDSQLSDLIDALRDCSVCAVAGQRLSGRKTLVNQALERLRYPTVHVNRSLLCLDDTPSTVVSLAKRLRRLVLVRTPPIYRVRSSTVSCLGRLFDLLEGNPYSLPFVFILDDDVPDEEALMISRLLRKSTKSKIVHITNYKADTLPYEQVVTIPSRSVESLRLMIQHTLLNCEPATKEWTLPVVSEFASTMVRWLGGTFDFGPLMRLTRDIAVYVTAHHTPVAVSDLAIQSILPSMSSHDKGVLLYSIMFAGGSLIIRDLPFEADVSPAGFLKPFEKLALVTVAVATICMEGNDSKLFVNQNVGKRKAVQISINTHRRVIHSSIDRLYNIFLHLGTQVADPGIAVVPLFSASSLGQVLESLVSRGMVDRHATGRYSASMDEQALVQMAEGLDEGLGVMVRGFVGRLLPH
ncbi:hypothetical protein J8273_0875 [Carpediemonas membranifera]|uniref:Uncharacterized protein n=1 Tax=Carpediemonas membranifera TaxID=201153 RepID=A0A8J6B1Q1_9EUKA|nr:hypothetical protein J8273_0875 [Carpediemonas membranifera]|eukprot:KAG9397385.1 hypothetical protein J8273_0875 [Carpediemonas membranifera]